MKKILKTNQAKLIEKELSVFSNYLHYYGITDAMTFEFSSNENEAAIDAVLASLTDEAIEAKLLKQNQVTGLYNAMVKDVYDEMEKVFGTRNDVSASATASTYEAMLKRPNAYKGVLGLGLATEVEAYAATKLAEADAYAIFRMERIAKFNSDKAAVLNA